MSWEASLAVYPKLGKQPEERLSNRERGEITPIAIEPTIKKPPRQKAGWFFQRTEKDSGWI
ncbi:MAG: hypothetical protein DIZ78_11970 [endosymbiont of Escarpia spicata]|uniref:Uncharacterized protein n=1 Tax=endosymbiont of Escarpia spicata TaxID=2200908 RepID=A0A370DL81_9GAMM|nr:MAG: hypothetical protein DIZ78_11970 [endosymbiont of Escarpia spicata]